MVRNRPDLWIVAAGGTDMRTDPDLAADAARGNDSAFAELVRRHQARVRGMSRRLTAAGGDADDIAQATFVTAWQKIGTYAGGTFAAWICTICYREFLQVRRRQRQEIGFDETAEIIPFDRSMADTGDKMDLSRALAKLPEAQRICVTLCVAASLSHREAAEATGWPLGTIKSHVTRGVAALRKHLAADQVA
ncbi:MAG: RNA polymerase sigma factor (sigma-70 family) [Hyphomonas sp.]|jgi:RNA polymerase sigma factor (sigma-70 family)